MIRQSGSFALRGNLSADYHQPLMAENNATFPEIPDIRMVVPCTDIDHHLDQLVGNLGFRIFSVFPADDPRVVIVERGGMHIRLEKHAAALEPGVLPSGMKASTLLEAVSDLPSESDDGDLSQAEFAVSAPSKDGWTSGRAGMLYRDLVPGRLKGRLIASQIRIEKGGPVPDYVHFHSVDFQVIYCLRGWATLVYQGQGEPFRFESGDCVLQPPGIRHRVIECSDGFEVIEVSSPAEHPTFAEYEIELPDREEDPEMSFDGQRFHRHSSKNNGDGRVDLGLDRPSAGAVTGEIIRFPDLPSSETELAGGRPAFIYVVSGKAELSGPQSGAISLEKDMACFISDPAGHTIAGRSENTEILVFGLAI